MMVRPDAISASNAPSSRPLKHCDMKLAQLIIGRTIRSNGQCRAAGIEIARAPSPALPRAQGRDREGVRSGSGVAAEIAAEGVGLLHQRRARHDLEHLPVV